jgi:NAD(P)-dependent dehydrogenase (short-subunit alcohol dehydrogenase family)
MILMDQVLEGKVAITTGGAGGVGSVFGRELARRGAEVVLADLNGDGARKQAESIATEELRVIGTALDVTDRASVDPVVTLATEQLGGVDIVVNSAALMAEIPYAPLSEFPLDWWDRVMAVNVKGPLVCSQAVIPAMVARGGGQIVNIASAGAFMTAGVYGVSKYALVAVTMNLASQLGPQGINVNAIAPGMVLDEAGQRALPEGQAREAIRSAVPLKSHIEGPPEDLVGTLVLLVSDAGAWITGQTISVDGGWIMRF